MKSQAVQSGFQAFSAHKESVTIHWHTSVEIVSISCSTMLLQSISFAHTYIVQFLTQVWGIPNKLLAAVLTNIQKDFNLAACKALGLVDKYITGPLWRILESDIHILDMPGKYCSLLEFLQRCTSSKVLMHARVYDW